MYFFIFAQLPQMKTSIDPGYLFVLLAAIAGLIVLRIYNNSRESIKNGTKKKNQKKYSGEQASTFEKIELDKKELKNIVAEYGFTHEQLLFLTNLCIRNRIAQPSRFLENRIELDKVLSRTFNQLQSIIPSTRENERNKTILFTLREKIENHRRASKTIKSTRSLPTNQAFTLMTKDDEHYPMTLYDNSSDGLVCVNPRDSFGNEVRFPLFSKLHCLFYGRSGQSYEFTTRILRYESGKNETKIVLSHSNSVKTLPNRTHERKLFETLCYFAHVSVANIVNGRHTEHKFYPSPRSFGGTILDISVGGCSIRTKDPLPQGEYIQIVCNLEDKIEEIIIGKIIKVIPTANPPETLMHIQFAKMSRATMNRIFTYIYNEGEIQK